MQCPICLLQLFSFSLQLRRVQLALISSTPIALQRRSTSPPSHYASASFSFIVFSSRVCKCFLCVFCVAPALFDGLPNSGGAREPVQRSLLVSSVSLNVSRDDSTNGSAFRHTHVRWKLNCTKKRATVWWEWAMMQRWECKDEEKWENSEKRKNGNGNGFPKGKMPKRMLLKLCVLPWD